MDLLSILIGLVGLVILLAGGFGVRAAFKSNRDTQTVTNYEKSLASWKERALAAEQDSTTKDTALTAKSAELVDLQARFEVVQDMVTGSSAVVQVGETVGQYFAELSARMEIMTRTLGIDPDQLMRETEAARPNTSGVELQRRDPRRLQQPRRDPPAGQIQNPNLREQYGERDDN